MVAIHNYKTQNKLSREINMNAWKIGFAAALTSLFSRMATFEATLSYWFTAKHWKKPRSRAVVGSMRNVPWVSTGRKILGRLSFRRTLLWYQWNLCKVTLITHHVDAVEHTRGLAIHWLHIQIQRCRRNYWWSHSLDGYQFLESCLLQINIETTERE